MYDKPNSQYSQLVMNVRKGETETPGSSVSEVRAKSAVVGTDLQSRMASSDSPYESDYTTNCLYNVCHYHPEYKKIVNKMAQSKLTGMVSSLAQNFKDQRSIGKI